MVENFRRLGLWQSTFEATVVLVVQRQGQTESSGYIDPLTDHRARLGGVGHESEAQSVLDDQKARSAAPELTTEALCELGHKHGAGLTCDLLAELEASSFVDQDQTPGGRSMQCDLASLESTRLVGGLDKDKPPPLVTDREVYVARPDCAPLEAVGGLCKERLAIPTPKLAPYRPPFDLP